MAIADKVNILNQKVRDLVNKESYKVYERVCGLSYSMINKQVVGEIIEKEKQHNAEQEKRKEAGETVLEFSEQYKSDEYIRKTTNELFFKLCDEYLKREGLEISFAETVRDGKEVIVFKVFKTIKEFITEVNFTYDLKLGKTEIKENNNKTELERRTEEIAKEKPIEEIKETKEVTKPDQVVAVKK